MKIRKFKENLKEKRQKTAILPPKLAFFALTLKG